MEPIKNAKMWLPHAWRRQKYEHDWAMHKYGMHGGWHTRIRLASARQGELGKWERVEHYPYPATARLARLLPPECVALGGKKMRSHRRGLSIATILEATMPQDLWVATHAEIEFLKKALDSDNEHLEALANMNRLRRIVR